MENNIPPKSTSPYIVNARFKGKAMSNEILNLPYGTQCGNNQNIITYCGKPICYNTSQNAYDYFSRNDDGNGLARGLLVKKIMDRLAIVDNDNTKGKHQERWNKLWDDERANKLKREDSPDYWLWSQKFYEAEIEELEHIWELIKDV